MCALYSRKHKHDKLTFLHFILFKCESPTVTMVTLKYEVDQNTNVQLAKRLFRIPAFIQDWNENINKMCCGLCDDAAVPEKQDYFVWDCRL